MLKIDGHDNAILGPGYCWRNGKLVQVLAYDAEKIRANLVDDGMTHEEAREFIEYNIEGAYLGEETPILVWTEDEY